MIMDAFHGRLTPRNRAIRILPIGYYSCRKTANRASSADEAVEFIKLGSEEAAQINRVLLKEMEKPQQLSDTNRHAYER